VFFFQIGRKIPIHQTIKNLPPKMVEGLNTANPCQAFSA
jgi:hypothetical protein